MLRVLAETDLFQGLSAEAIQRLAAIAHPRPLGAGEYLFLLGEQADSLYVVATGMVDLCLPMTLRGVVKDVPVESATRGSALGWSALVKPYRFTLSARASVAAEVIGFARTDLQQLFASAPEVGNGLHANLSELVGFRLLTFQALWVRELQRALEADEPRQAQAR